LPGDDEDQEIVMEAAAPIPFINMNIPELDAFVANLARATSLAWHVCRA
jgi:hypothetical protein